MLRAIRILGIIAFAGLSAWSAYSIHTLYRSGELFEEYNTDGRAMASLLVFSALGLGGMGYLEIALASKSSKRLGYGQSVDNFEEEEDARKKASNIYTAPKTIDDWASKHRRTKPKNEKRYVDFSLVWLGILKFIGVTLPLVYSYLLIEQWGIIEEDITLSWVMRGFMGWMVICSVGAFIGLLGNHRWGQALGYSLAIFNLLLFPYGIGIGLILLVCLLGAGPAFSKAEHERLKNRRHRKSSSRNKDRRLAV